jgi:hypothetical protein
VKPSESPSSWEVIQCHCSAVEFKRMFVRFFCCNTGHTLGGHKEKCISESTYSPPGETHFRNDVDISSLALAIFLKKHANIRSEHSDIFSVEIRLGVRGEMTRCPNIMSMNRWIVSIIVVALWR